MAHIITNGILIYGAAETVDAAWAHARAELAYAQIQLIDDDADSDACFGSWMRESDLVCMPATPALVADVADMGGAIGWRERDGVAMTTDEADMTAEQEA